ERRRPTGRLRPEEDARLLATTYRVRVLSGQLGQQRIELAGGNAGVPRLQRRLQRRHQLLEVPPRLGRHVHPRSPTHVRQVLLDLPLQVDTPLVIEQVPLVVGE